MRALKGGLKMNLFKKFFSPYIGLPRDIYFLFLARVINSMGNFVFPLMTMLLTDKLKMSPKAAGEFISLAAASYLPGSILGGKLADKYGRKSIFVFCQTIAGLFILACAFIDKTIIPWFVILFGVLNGAAQPINSAMVTDLTNKENRKQAFSLIYLGINVGFAVGPLIAGFLYINYFNLIFIGNAVAIFLSVFFIWYFVREPEIKHDELDEMERPKEGNTFKVLFERKELLYFALISSIFAFSYAQVNFSTTIQLKDVYGENAARFMSIINSINATVVITFTTIIIHITRKNKAILNITIAGIFFAIGFGIQYFFVSFYPYILSTFIWTLGEILHATNSGVYIADHTPASHRGRFNSLMSIVQGLGHGISPLIMGRFIQKYGVRNVWPLIFILSSAASIFMYLLSKYDKKENLGKKEGAAI